MKTFEITFMIQPPRQLELDGAQTSINGLSYERVPCKGIRFKYNDMNTSPIGHLWFLRGEDLCNKTLRIYYSGIVPLEISFFISRSSYGERYAMNVRLDNTESTRYFDLTIPDKPIFKQTSFFGFNFERRGARSKAGEFYIEKVELLEDPELAGYRNRAAWRKL
jgi:hypothetical protein